MLHLLDGGGGAGPVTRPGVVGPGPGRGAPDVNHRAGPLEAHLLAEGRRSHRLHEHPSASPVARGASCLSPSGPGDRRCPARPQRGPACPLRLVSEQHRNHGTCRLVDDHREVTTLPDLPVWPVRSLHVSDLRPGKDRGDLFKSYAALGGSATAVGGVAPLLVIRCGVIGVLHGHRDSRQGLDPTPGPIMVRGRTVLVDVDVAVRSASGGSPLSGAALLIASAGLRLLHISFVVLGGCRGTNAGPQVAEGLVHPLKEQLVRRPVLQVPWIGKAAQVGDKHPQRQPGLVREAPRIGPSAGSAEGPRRRSWSLRPHPPRRSSAAATRSAPSLSQCPADSPPDKALSPRPPGEPAPTLPAARPPPQLTVELRMPDQLRPDIPILDNSFHCHGGQPLRLAQFERLAPLSWAYLSRCGNAVFSVVASLKG